MPQLELPFIEKNEKQLKFLNSNKVIQNKYINTIVLTLIMFNAFVFLFILNEYRNQPIKAQCSSYINTNCEGYHVPMCERE